MTIAAVITRRCSKCGEEKPLEDFYRQSGAREDRRPDCKRCCVAKQKAYAKTPRGREVRAGVSYRHGLGAKYGISRADYEEMLLAQDGVCAICCRPETARGPLSGAQRRLCVDHDHDTGEVRGLLCLNCNTILGRADDDADRLEAAARYLREARHH